MDQNNTNKIKVSSNSVPGKVAGAIANIVRTNGSCEITCIGAGALNQAVKSVAVAAGYASTSGMELVCKPAFGTVDLEGTARTCIILTCFAR